VVKEEEAAEEEVEELKFMGSQVRSAPSMRHRM
jgi:hypothetical protein